MARYEIAPTRTNLARLKADLAFAYEGHELLEQKRDILMLELKQLAARAVEAQKRLDATMAEAYQALTEAQMADGVTVVHAIGQSATVVPDMELRERRVMGVGIPAVEWPVDGAALDYDPYATSVWTDEAVVRFREVLKAVREVAQTRIAVIRLARAIQKTIRRVNALEKVLIPDYQETVQYIRDSLEESDRQALFNLKLVKKRLGAEHK